MAIVVGDQQDQPATSEKPPGSGERASHPRLVGVAIGIAVVLVVAIVGFARAGGGSSALPSGVAREEVRQGDEGVTLSQTAVAAGRVGFVIRNQGTMGHELVVFRTDVPADKLPLDKDGNVNEESPLLHNVLDTGGNIAQGHSRTIIVRLAAGHYVVICNLPGHYQAGMRADLTVH